MRSFARTRLDARFAARCARRAAHLLRMRCAARTARFLVRRSCARGLPAAFVRLRARCFLRACLYLCLRFVFAPRAHKRAHNAAHAVGLRTRARARTCVLVCGSPTAVLTPLYAYARTQRTALRARARALQFSARHARGCRALPSHYAYTFTTAHTTTAPRYNLHYLASHYFILPRTVSVIVRSFTCRYLILPWHFNVGLRSTALPQRAAFTRTRAVPRLRRRGGSAPTYYTRSAVAAHHLHHLPLPRAVSHYRVAPPARSARRAQRAALRAFPGASPPARMPRDGVAAMVRGAPPHAPPRALRVTPALPARALHAARLFCARARVTRRARARGAAAAARALQRYALRVLVRVLSLRCRARICAPCHCARRLSFLSSLLVYAAAVYLSRTWLVRSLPPPPRLALPYARFAYARSRRVLCARVRCWRFCRGAT